MTRFYRLVSVVGVLSAVMLVAWTPVSAGADSGGVPVTVTFQGTGQYTVDQTYTGGGGQCTTHDVWTLAWTSTFQTTIDSSGALQGAPGSLTSGSPGTANMTVGGLCTYHNTVPPCSSALTSPSAAPTLSVSGTDPERVEAQSIASGISFTCSSPQDGFIVGRDSGVFNAALPDSMSAIADIPSTEMVPGNSIAVSSGNAPGHVTSSCTGVGPQASGNSACAASLTWDGTITISCANPVGKVTLSEGDAPKAGGEICAGQTVRTGPGGRLEITFNDGSIVRLGPSSEAEITDANFQSEPRQISVKVILGIIWSKTSTLLGADNKFEVETDRAAAGVRGCNLTAGVDPTTGKLVMHVAQGRGFYMLGGAEHAFPAGYTVITDGRHAKLVPDWPAAQQALVPAGDMPPKLSAVRFSGHNLGPAAKLRVRLAQAAALKVQILKGRRVVASFRSNARPGSNIAVLRHRALPKGTYTVIVTATRAKLVSLTQLTLRAR